MSSLYIFSLSLGKIFTPILIDFYQQVNSLGKQFEIVFASFDNSESDFESFRKKMPWGALPYNDPRIEKITTKIKIDELPQLSVLSKNSTILSSDLKNDVILKGVGAFDSWLAKL